MSDDERREHKRHQQSNNALKHYKVENVEDGTYYGRLVDISSGGVQLECLEQRQVGDSIEAKIEVPYSYFSKTSVNLEIICKWCKAGKDASKYYCGFEFVDKDSIDSIFLDKLINLSMSKKLSMSLFDAALDFEE
jgi:hypothetical protein